MNRKAFGASFLYWVDFTWLRDLCIMTLERARALCIWTFITGDWPREKLNIFKLWSPIARVHALCLVWFHFQCFQGLWSQIPMPFDHFVNRKSLMILKGFSLSTLKKNTFRGINPFNCKSVFLQSRSYKVFSKEKIDQEIP